MKKLLICISTVILCWGCFSQNERNSHSDNVYHKYIREYNKLEIDSIIQDNDYTIIFAWTQWCRASHSQLKDHLIPFFSEIPDNVSVISICCTDASKLADFLKENDCKYPVYLLSGSWMGLDKWRLNRHFHTLFGNYKSVNYVPVVILCDTQKQILNWDTINKDYHGINYSILQIKNNTY